MMEKETFLEFNEKIDKLFTGIHPSEVFLFLSTKFLSLLGNSGLSEDKCLQIIEQMKDLFTDYRQNIGEKE